jgi:hypothetical protein
VRVGVLPCVCVSGSCCAVSFWPKLAGGFCCILSLCNEFNVHLFQNKKQKNKSINRPNHIYLQQTEYQIKTLISHPPHYGINITTIIIVLKRTNSTERIQNPRPQQCTTSLPDNPPPSPQHSLPAASIRRPDSIPKPPPPLITIIKSNHPQAEPGPLPR